MLHVAKTIKLFIGGEFPRTESGRSFPVKFQGSEQIYANVCQGSRKDLRNAVVSAKVALKTWSSKTAFLRSQVLYRMAEMLEGKRAEVETIPKKPMVKWMRGFRRFFTMRALRTSTIK